MLFFSTLLILCALPLLVLCAEDYYKVQPLPLSELQMLTST